MELTFDNNDTKATIVTIIYIIIVILLLFFYKVSSNFEIQNDNGLIVDFGYTDMGFGDEEPSKDNKINQINIPSPGNPPFSHKVREDLVIDKTSEFSISTNEKVKKEDIRETEKSTIKSDKISDNPTTETTKSEEKPKEVIQSAIFNGFKGNGDNSSTSSSQGNTSGEGNMGDLSGSKSDNYLGTNTGLGDAGSGRGMIGSGLRGRKLKSIPPIVDQSNKTGKIFIKVKVNKSGTVISSQYTAQGSSITDSDLIHKCEANAKKAKFSPSETKDVDYGVLIYTFIVK